MPFRGTSHISTVLAPNEPRSVSMGGMLHIASELHANNQETWPWDITPGNMFDYIWDEGRDPFHAYSCNHDHKGSSKIYYSIIFYYIFSSYFYQIIKKII